MSPTGVCLTETELQVARTFCGLHDIIIQFDLRGGRAASSPLFLDNLRWGARRRRSLPDYPPPPLPPLPPPGGEKEAGDGCVVPASSPAAAGISSPATPLSVPGSGDEDNDPRPNSAAPSAPPKQAKNPKRHKERVEEQRQKIASLTNDKAHLNRVIEEYRSRIERLRANNSVLREVQAKAAAINYGQTSNYYNHGHPYHQPSVLGLFPAAAAASRPLSASWAILDLNATPEEAEEEEDGAVAVAVPSEWMQQQQSWSYKVASMETRKRRREIQREKSSCASSRHTSKALRLR